MTITLDIADALDLLQYVVDEAGGDHTVPCVYTSHGQPNCIVARIMSIAGTPDSELQSWEGHDLREVYEEGLLQEVKLTMGALMVLDAAQAAQDGRNENFRPHPWSEAYEAGMKAAERFIGVIPHSAVRAIVNAAKMAPEDREMVEV